MKSFPLTYIIKETGISKSELLDALKALGSPVVITKSVIIRMYKYIEDNEGVMEGYPLLSLL